MSFLGSAAANPQVPRPRSAGDRPLRVVLYVKGFPPRETGGPVEVAAHLARGLLGRARLELTLVVQTDSTEFEIRGQLGWPRNVSVLRLPYFPTVRELASLGPVVRAFRSADVIHFNEFPFRHMPLVVLAKARGVPVLFSMHGLVSREIDSFLGPSYPLTLQGAGGTARLHLPRVGRIALLSAYRSLARMWTAVIVPSESLKQEATAVEHVPAARVSVIPHGVDAVEAWTGADVRRDGPPRILFVGKLEPVKGPDLLLDALALLLHSDHSFEATIVGSGSMEETLRERATALGLQQVAFLGVRRGEELRSLYRASDIVVIPSRQESLSLVVLEAMAAGRPILATNVGGIPEVVRDPRNALLVPPEPGAIAAGLRELLERPGLRDSMARANLADASFRSWPTVVDRYLQLYGRLLWQARRPAKGSA